VAELTLDRPKALNAISSEMARQLTESCAQLGKLPGLSAVILSSTSPRAFCIGADLKERARFDEAKLLQQRPLVRAAFEAVRDIEVPVVAAVAGYALGGGFELALSCDLIVADKTAVLGLPETSVGLVPGGGGTQLVARRAGTGAAADLVFTARRVGAAEALRLRLVDRVVERGSARTVALELARAMATNSPVSLKAAKRALRLGSYAHLPAGLQVEDAAWLAAATSPDRAEGIAAFVEKRVPRWPSQAGPTAGG
jgi:enoyl-CoA hydratase/carnithine racemase